MIPTPHIEAKSKDDFAKTIIMPGDPLRAKLIAETYLKDIKLVNSVRNMLGFTGTYKGKKLTIMAHGMGMPSAGIYTAELFNHYDIDQIIRIGSCGSYVPEINVYDVLLVTESYCESDYVEIVTGEITRVVKPDAELTAHIAVTADKLNLSVTQVKVHCSDVFYRKNFDDYINIYNDHGCKAVEMETAAIFANAKAYGKKAACLLTVSDSLVTKEVTTSQERQNSFTKMIEIALASV
ncbi:purine-nucleoside phosphorylase [Cysteiniphilum halobium]|uniref:purine-nucleoside phosphorylase n=1 Tax=Cysteiniphilum halobium TaxID=2219059 RepID=UPI000E654435|nr:purine-nucleoside phosphorylase [Cysteiniphilum halobium]